MIWKYSLPGPRYFEFVTMYEPGDWEVSFAHCKDKKIPQLAVNQQSRGEALKEYIQFRTNCTGCPPIYVSPEVDIFCFAYSRNMEEILNELNHLMQQIPIKRLATQVGIADDAELTKDWLYALELDELLLVDDKVELTYDDAGIVGFKDGWTIEDGGFMQLNEMVTYCEELKMEDPTWKAPLIRMGSWVVASPSEYTHTNKWLQRAWKAYGKGVMDGTEEKREDDGNYWTHHWPYYKEE
jgi:hypothetical protein